MWGSLLFIRKSLVDSSVGSLKVIFKGIANELPRGYLEDLERERLLDGLLTFKGARYVKEIVEKFRDL